LNRAGWAKPWKLDQFPFREDPAAAARASIVMLSRLLDIADSIEPKQLAELQENQDALGAQGFVFDVLFSQFRQDRRQG